MPHSRSSAGKMILAKMNIQLSTDSAARFVSGEDKGNFIESQTNKSILGRRAGEIIEKMTTPQGSFPAIPSVAMREALRSTKRNIERFRSPEVAQREEELQRKFSRFTNAREEAVTRLRSLSPQLFRTQRDIEAEQRRVDPFHVRNLLSQQKSVRDARIGEVTGEIQSQIDKEIDATHKLAIQGRMRERDRLMVERDIAAVEGTSGTTPLTVQFGRGRREVVAATGNPTILQGITPELQDDINARSKTPSTRPLSTSTGGTDLAKKVRETRLATARQRLKRTRDSSSE